MTGNKRSELAWERAVLSFSNRMSPLMFVLFFPFVVFCCCFSLFSLLFLLFLLCFAIAAAPLAFGLCAILLRRHREGNYTRAHTTHKRAADTLLRYTHIPIASLCVCFAGRFAFVASPPHSRLLTSAAPIPFHSSISRHSTTESNRPNRTESRRSETTHTQASSASQTHTRGSVPFFVPRTSASFAADLTRLDYRSAAPPR